MKKRSLVQPLSFSALQNCSPSLGAVLKDGYLRKSEAKGLATKKLTREALNMPAQTPAGKHWVNLCPFLTFSNNQKHGVLQRITQKMNTYLPAILVKTNSDTVLFKTRHSGVCFFGDALTSSAQFCLCFCLFSVFVFHSLIFFAGFVPMGTIQGVYWMLVGFLLLVSSRFRESVGLWSVWVWRCGCGSLKRVS